MARPDLTTGQFPLHGSGYPLCLRRDGIARLSCLQSGLGPAKGPVSNGKEMYP